MSEEIKKQTEIKLDVGLDVNHVPVKINWSASDSGEAGECKSFLLSIWDGEEENSMSINLWNKEMSIYDMQRFFHQTLLTMSDTFKNATGDVEVSKQIRDFAQQFAEKTKILG